MSKTQSSIALVVLFIALIIGFYQVKGKLSPSLGEISAFNDAQAPQTLTQPIEVETEAFRVDEALLLQFAEQLRKLELIEQQNSHLLEGLDLSPANDELLRAIEQWQRLLRSSDGDYLQRQQAIESAIIEIDGQLTEKHYLQENLGVISRLIEQVKLRQKQIATREHGGVTFSELLSLQHLQWMQDVRQQLETQQWFEGRKSLQRLLQSLEQWIDSADQSLVLRKRSEQMRAEWESLQTRQMKENENAQLAKQNHQSAEQHLSLGYFEQADHRFDIAILAWAKAKQATLLEIASPEMVEIPSGRFLMGDRDGSSNKRDQLPVHEQEVAAFKMSKYETSFEEYIAYAVLAGIDVPDDAGWGKGKRPVINVSWLDAQQYARWLSEQTGQYFRLPTEAEWEYAARAGTETAYIWGDSIKPYANCEGCKRWNNDRTTEVASFKMNAFGLYDMSGNVWEWVSDCYRSRYDEPISTSACEQRVLRGGSWADLPPSLKVANRSSSNEEFFSERIGFRLVEEKQ